MTLPQVRLFGVVYVFVGNRERTDGAIATVEQVETFTPSFAYLFPDGTVRRFNALIASADDLEWLDLDVEYTVQ